MWKAIKAVVAILDVVPGWIYAIALAVALTGVALHKSTITGLRADIKVEQNQRTADEAQAKIDKANAVTEALSESARLTNKLQGVKDAALQKANEQLQAKTADASRARGELERLRDQSASDRVRLSKAAKQAVVDYAATASELLDQCSRRYQELADKADGHAIDAGMIDGWPVSNTSPK